MTAFIKASESQVMDAIRNELSYKRNMTMFRNNVGMAAAYDFQRQSLRRPLQIIRYGLYPGSSDLIGYKSVQITPDMVGKNIAVFTAIEVKRSTNFKVSEAQEKFIHDLNAAGGTGIVAKSIEDLNKIL